MFIHNESGRNKKPFLDLECNAWSQQRINELLFGNAGKTSDDGSDKHIVEIAEGGTLFLNHIDELSNEVQYRIYKLMTGYYRLYSDMGLIPANVRIIAATNKNLQELITKGEFREDLYYALSVITISIPPLRTRKEDISCIVDYWTSYYGDTYSKPVHFSKNTYDCISEYSWPGNTRQLKHYCQKLVLNTPHRGISEAFARNELEYLSSSDNGNGAGAELKGRKNEASAVRTALENNRGNKTKAAEELGISKTTLWRKIQKYGITTTYIR
jgi:DNA-binding NtrC family response regulator